MQPYQIQKANGYREFTTGVREVVDRAAYSRYRADADITTCGNCGRSWDDSIPTTWTPTPSGRCPFEYEHLT